MNRKIFSLKAIKFLRRKHSRQFSRSIRSEIEEHNRISALDFGSRFSVFHYNRRDYKLIRNICVVRSLHSLDGAARRVALSESYAAIRLFNSLPAVISVHSIVSTGYSSYLTRAYCVHLLLQLLYIAFSARGRRISAIHKAMNIYVFYSLLSGHAYQRDKMVYVAVNSSVRKQAHKMQSSAFGIIHCG